MTTATDLKHFRRVLENLRAALLNNIRAEKDELDTNAEENPDPADLAGQSFYEEKVSTLLYHSEQRLEDVEAALKRIDDGSYGVCLQCGEDINPERLDALPYTTVCIKCKAKLEKPIY